MVDCADHAPFRSSRAELTLAARPSNRQLVRLAVLALAALLAYLGGDLFPSSSDSVPSVPPPEVAAERGAEPFLERPTAEPGEAAILGAYENKISDLVVQARGRVEKLLPDDLRGSRHQKFIVRLPSGHTVLISHNIDLAPRLDALEEGDQLSFRGEYEWNERGGVVHWTHHDPRGRRIGGWLEHDGRRYQ